MRYSITRRSLRICSAAALLLCAPGLFADLIQNNPFLPPVDGVYKLADTCVSVVCLGNISIGNFQVIETAIAGPDELTRSNAKLTANLFSNNLGNPGAFISPLVLSGQVNITYFDKTALAQSGTFNSQITFFDLTGAFTGPTGTHTIEAKLNPAKDSLGVTSVAHNGNGTWLVSSSFQISSEISIDGGTFVPGPGRDANLEPEPVYYAALGGVLSLLIAIRVIKPKRNNAT
ncbi:MAG: hypothetical protein ABJC09_16975 [Terriglobia bacterium]